MTQGISASIMVIGTDLHFCYLMRRYVRESAHPLLFAGPDAQALEMIRQEKPAAIVLEAGLPDAEGRQILKLIKSNPDTCQIPVVLCSWREDDLHDIQETADIYLRMPILYGDFLAILTNLGI